MSSTAVGESDAPAASVDGSLTPATLGTDSTSAARSAVVRDPRDGGSAPRNDRRVTLLVCMAMVTWALFLFRPWVDVPFEFFDFGDFLPVLRAGDDFGSRHELLTEFYARHGRYLPLTLIYTNAKWTALGWNVVAWQLLNFALMSLNTALAYAFLRRAGASRLGAVVGCSGFLLFCAATSVWQRVHTSQAQGLLFVLGAAMLAPGLRERTRWVLRAALIALMVALAVLVKETFVAVAPFLWLVAACHSRDGWHRPALDRATRGLGAFLIMAVIGTAVPILWVKLHAPADGYANMYDVGSIDARAIALKLRTFLLPMGDSVRRWLADVVFAAIVSVGFIARQRATDARGELWLVVTALSLSLAGAAVHLPWGGHGPHYASSYMLGPAMLLAFAVSGARPRRVAARVGLFGALAALAVYGSLRTREEVENFLRMRRAHAELTARAEQLARQHHVVGLRVLTADTTAYCDLCVLLTDYGRAFLKSPLPAVRAASCAALADLAGGSGMSLLVVERAGACAVPTRATLPPHVSATTMHVVEHRFTGRPGPTDSTRLHLWITGSSQLRASRTASPDGGTAAAALLPAQSPRREGLE
jgi:hypothetical protein